MSVEMRTVNVNQTINKKDPVKKGAAIGAGGALGLMGAGVALDTFKKTNMLKTYFQGVSDAAQECGANKKVKAVMFGAGALFLAVIAAGVTSISAGIGAGIGKLVKNHNEKKEAEKQEIVNQVKTELIEDAIN